MELSTRLLTIDDHGLHCPKGQFHIDPWRPVDYAVITHAHADHARRGSRRYLTTDEGEHVLRTRMNDDAKIETIPYGRKLTINGVTVSLHPAGHVLGSAQIRLEYRGEVAVVSGDYKVLADRTCRPFEPVRCHTFVSESTFGLPIYRWVPQDILFADINAWWRQNADDGRCSVLYAYSLGKAQRLIGGVDASIGPIYAHGAVQTCNQDYRNTGIDLPETLYTGHGKKTDFAGSLVVAPPSARGSTWTKKFGRYASAFASGWMMVRGSRRRRAVDRGFVLSDHADWPGLIGAIRETGAEKVFLTHGSTAVMTRYLREQGYDAHPLETYFEGEQDETRSENSGDDSSASEKGNEVVTDRPVEPG